MPDGLSPVQRLIPVYHCTRRTTGAMVWIGARTIAETLEHPLYATPHRLTGTTRYERGIQGDDRTDYGGPAGRYDQMVSDDA